MVEGKMNNNGKEKDMSNVLRSLTIVVIVIIYLSGTIEGETTYFTNVGPSAGVANTGSGNGAAWIDYDRDGWMDICLVHDPGSGAFYRNKHDTTFQNVTSSVGINLCGNIVRAADYDGDGWTDVLVGTSGNVRLYRNTGAGTFLNVTAASGISVSFSAWDVAWGNYYDKDGKPDLWIGDVGKLFRNNGNGTFTDATLQAFGGAGPVYVSGYDCQSVWIDYDRDGYDDLFVAPPAGNFLLYHNQQDGTFKDVSVQSGVSLPSKVGRTVVGDFNGDTYPDIYFFGGSSKNCLFANNKDGSFSEVAESVGVKNTNGTGINGNVAFLDFDRDGDMDLFANGGRYGSNNFFRNDGGTFTDITPLTGLSNTDDSHDIIVGDFNRDGYPDIYEVNFTGYMSSANKLLENTIPEPAALSLLVVGGLGLLIRRRRDSP